MLICKIFETYAVKTYLTNKIDLLRWVQHKPTPGTLLNIHSFIKLSQQLQRKIKTTFTNSQNWKARRPRRSLVPTSVSVSVNLDLFSDWDPVEFHPSLAVAGQLTGWPTVSYLKGDRCHWIVITVLFTLSTLVRAFRRALNRWMKSRLDRYTCSEMPYFLQYVLSWLSVIFSIKILLFMLL